MWKARYITFCVAVISSLIVKPIMANTAECEPIIATLTSAEGIVEARTSNNTWHIAQTGDVFCPGHTLRTGNNSRAALELSNHTQVRLDAHTTLTVTGPREEQGFWAELINGVSHFISRVPRTLKVKTPYVNAGVEGTEFLVQSDDNQSTVIVYEGTVSARNDAGTVLLNSGMAATAKSGQAPIITSLAQPRDAVQWALYYPPVIQFNQNDFADMADNTWQSQVAKSIDAYQQGRLADAINALQQIKQDVQDPRFYTYRASLQLATGQVDKAQTNLLQQALTTQPNNGDALALQSIIAVVQNDKERALALANKAVGATPDNASAQLTLSYALQAHFELEQARTTLEQTVANAPDNALVWSRLAELHLMFRELDLALAAAKKAVELNPSIARTQTVLGYAELIRTDTSTAQQSFAKAIVLDQGAPLPRLGLGLARIREGDLEQGRREIEIATVLDPSNALIRSYLGKAYYEERRSDDASEQFVMAKELDPNDPTPFLYDAILKQSMNRPVEALQDIQRSIELNNNRAVYRSRFLLDSDDAARSASLGRIYQDLGFEKRALLEAWRSVNIDPANHSAHRLLADTYASLPRHEIARVSELLQAQLMQPINNTPIQPQLAESELGILSGAGPSELSYSEFNPLFSRDKLSAQLNAVFGGNNTRGNDLVLTGMRKNMLFSLGQFYYESDGIKENNDQKRNIYNAFAQIALNDKTSLQWEYRYNDSDLGDLKLHFNPDNFSDMLRIDEEKRTRRMGIHYHATSKSRILGSYIQQDRNHTQHDSDTNSIVRDDGWIAEFQYQYYERQFSTIAGVGHFDGESDRDISLNLDPISCMFLTCEFSESKPVKHSNAYLYFNGAGISNLDWTLGMSANWIENIFLDERHFNPKLGMIWTPQSATTIRLAAFRVLGRDTVGDQTLEPTQIAGFNQFFDDHNSTDSKRYGIGIDQQLTANFQAGLELSGRDLNIPIAASNTINSVERDEVLGRAYMYWLPHDKLALTIEYQYEQTETAEELVFSDDILDIKTHRLPLTLSVFNENGFSFSSTASFISQEIVFFDAGTGFAPPINLKTFGDDQFWVVDAEFSYKLPSRLGAISVRIKNLFDENFHFQDTDTANPTVAKERLILGQLTIAF